MSHQLFYLSLELSVAWTCRFKAADGRGCWHLPPKIIWQADEEAVKILVLAPSPTSRLSFNNIHLAVRRIILSQNSGDEVGFYCTQITANDNSHVTFSHMNATFPSLSSPLPTPRANEATRHQRASD
ncbi:hypothetical protein NXS19_006395 [Fusarium pseudograminearum]|nr:hypothetical protein NXS19_006395 [Fusarium pseudograminearum]